MGILYHLYQITFWVFGEVKQMKSELTIQFAGKDSTESKLMAAAKADYKAKGNKPADIKKLELYVQPENSIVYYVVNDGAFNGEFQL